MKKLYIVILSAYVMSSCNGWPFQLSPYNPPTPFLPPTQTPLIVSPTPAVIGVASSTPQVSTPIIASATPFPIFTPTSTPFIPPADTPTFTATVLVPVAAVSVEVLGCNTSIDITHGMGEVTNAFVTLKNTGNVDLTNLRATLIALDEGREHPDKTVEIAYIPAAYQVTLKLTVDSTYQEETPIQIEVTADGGLFQRVGEASCRDIGLVAPSPSSLITPVPINP
jgi:predicted small secreted protein